MRIIVTIGPVSQDTKVLREIIKLGIDTIRLNFSHFHEDEFKKVISEVRKLKKDVSIIGDLCGKKIRVYDKITDTYKVKSNDIVYFCGMDLYEILLNNIEKNSALIPLTITSKEIQDNDIKKIYMKDGTMSFDIIGKDKVFLKAIVKDGGVIRAGKGCNIPNINRIYNELSKKDKEDIKWAINNGIDIISQSYVEGESEIIQIQKYIKKLGLSRKEVNIFSKIETIKGFDNYNEILNISDGIIIARGDLVPECGIVDTVINEFKLLNKLKRQVYDAEIIIATHILDSMKNSNKPSVSELESIYNFIRYGVTGFLLSGETSVGKNPIKTAAYLKKLTDIYHI